MGKKASAAFVAVFLAIAAFPVIGMLWAPTMTTTENHELAEVPEIFLEDGSVNLEYLSDWGDWISDHFAYREQLVTADALLRAGLFATSATDQVIIGKDGWLFYEGTIGDWDGESALADRTIANAANNLALMKEYVESRGAEFVVALAPNKNSLYGEQMPERYLEVGSGNLDALQDALAERGVLYADLLGALESDDSGEQLYFDTDTHWNNMGAAVGYSEIMETLGLNYTDFASLSFTVEATHTGDLDSMLFPLATTLQMEYTFDIETQWEYTVGDDVEDSVSMTTSAGEATGGATLVAFRDSFANALIPMLAQDFSECYFTKMVPYDMAVVDSLSPDVVLVEKAERNIVDFATSPGVFEAPLRDIEWEAGQDASSSGLKTTIAAGVNGPYLEISGEIDPSVTSDDGRVYVAIRDGSGQTVVREALTTSIVDDDGDIVSDNGFEMYVYLSDLEGDSITVDVLTEIDGIMTSVGVLEIDVP